MTYADFVAAVLVELGTDGTRRGIEALRTRTIRDAVVDLQRFIRAYRDGHTTNYAAGDLTEKGYAHLGTLPDQAKPKAFYTVSLVPDETTGDLPDPNIYRNRMDQVAWTDRQRLIDGKWDARSYTVAISPFGRQFMVHPLVNDEVYLMLVWDGLKIDFEDADVVPWPEQAAEAIACYVKAKILRVVDKRLDLAQAEYNTYLQKRLQLWREQNEAQFVSNNDEEYVSGAEPVPGTSKTQTGYVDLAIGATSAAITFPAAFAAVPIVDCWVVMPDNTAFNITANPDGSTISTTGFTGLLAAAVPASGYKLYWTAAPASS